MILITKSDGKYNDKILNKKKGLVKKEKVKILAEFSDDTIFFWYNSLVIKALLGVPLINDRQKT